MRVKKTVVVLAIIGVLYVGGTQLDGIFNSPNEPPLSNEVLASAIRAQKNDVQVTGSGIVTRVLSDDTDGSRHQRFIIAIASGNTLLVAHNIDIAPRVEPLALGDSVAFNGVYEWNPQGGVIHWTHHDPDGRHAAGWLKHNGRTFQ